MGKLERYKKITTSKKILAISWIVCLIITAVFCFTGGFPYNYVLSPFEYTAPDLGGGSNLSIGNLMIFFVLVIYLIIITKVSKVSWKGILITILVIVILSYTFPVILYELGTVGGITYDTGNIHHLIAHLLHD